MLMLCIIVLVCYVCFVRLSRTTVTGFPVLDQALHDLLDLRALLVPPPRWKLLCFISMLVC